MNVIEESRPMVIDIILTSGILKNPENIFKPDSVQIISDWIYNQNFNNDLIYFAASFVTGYIGNYLIENHGARWIIDDSGVIFIEQPVDINNGVWKRLNLHNIALGLVKNKEITIKNIISAQQVDAPEPATMIFSAWQHHIGRPGDL